MVRGLYTTATSMQVQMNKMDVITNNMANADTIAFKKDLMLQKSFEKQLTKRIDELGEDKIGKMSMGVGTNDVVTNFKQGSLKNTNGDFDFAIEGEGFFTVDTPRGERYTRCGNFSLSNDGYLIDSNGYKVLDENNNSIMVGTGKLSIGTNGTVAVDGKQVGKIMLTNFEDLKYLKKEGEGMYSTQDGAKKTNTNAIIKQGFTESSNVNIVREMVNMISLSRNYEANQKVIQTTDSLLDKAVNQVGRL